uniref:CCHC-type domain-containing protein n=1 Tax=Trichobilharzia regenti TaxID=157069 RepID=A0AA85JFE5_TRIRE|nr:unnamed protein product [Trichobilharzia regenti]
MKMSTVNTLLPLRQYLMSCCPKSKIQVFMESNPNCRPHVINKMQREIKNIRPCFSCGKIHLPSTCHFRGGKCHKCGKVGHIKSVCRSSNSYVTQNSYNSPNLSSKMESMCLLTFQNTQSHPMKTFTTSSATQASTVSRVFENEVAELQCELSKTRKK